MRNDRAQAAWGLGMNNDFRLHVCYGALGTMNKEGCALRMDPDGSVHILGLGVFLGGVSVSQYHLCASEEGESCACVGTALIGHKYATGEMGTMNSVDDMLGGRHHTQDVQGSVDCTEEALGALGGGPKWCFCRGSVAAQDPASPGAEQEELRDSSSLRCSIPLSLFWVMLVVREIVKALAFIMVSS